MCNGEGLRRRGGGGGRGDRDDCRAVVVCGRGVPVYGGPTYTPGVGGYKGQRDGWMTFNSFATVNDAGTAAGMTVKYDAAGTDLGTRAFRWDASGAAPVELGILGNAGQQLWRRRRCGD